jgi:hypothetical protein
MKTDVYRGVMWYALHGENIASALVPVPVERVKEVIKLNRKDVLPEILVDIVIPDKNDEPSAYSDVVGQESITRFENKNKGKNKSKQRSKGRGGNRPNQRSKQQRDKR